MIVAADILARFPGAFIGYDTAFITLIITEAATIIDEDVWGDDYDIGLTYLTAHLIASSTAPGGGGVSVGPVSKRRVGDVELTFATPTAPFNADDLYNTVYGKRFAWYRKVHQGGPSVPV